MVFKVWQVCAWKRSLIVFSSLHWTHSQVRDNWGKSGNHDNDECDGVWFGNGGRGNGRSSAAGFIAKDPGLMAAYWLYKQFVHEDDFNLLRTLPEEKQWEVGATRDGAGPAAPASDASSSRARGKRTNEGGDAGSRAAAEVLAKAIKEASKSQPTDGEVAYAALLCERAKMAEEDRRLKRLDMYLSKAEDPLLSSAVRETYKKRAENIQKTLDAEDGSGE